jgi:hypothetical protein
MRGARESTAKLAEMPHCQLYGKALAHCVMTKAQTSLVKAGLGETVKALAVLALFVYSLAPHLPVAASGPGGAGFAAALCGGGPVGDDPGDHKVCHACRVGIADLPAPPAIGERCETALLLAPRPVEAIDFGTVPHTVSPARAPPASS